MEKVRETRVPILSDRIAEEQEMHVGKQMACFFAIVPVELHR
jgi:hypothetical protein